MTDFTHFRLRCRPLMKSRHTGMVAGEEVVEALAAGEVSVCRSRVALAAEVAAGTEAGVGAGAGVHQAGEGEAEVEAEAEEA